MDNVKVAIIDSNEKVPSSKSQKKNKKSKLVLIIVLVILDLLGISGYILAYGPWSYLRDLLITTSMTTMSHKYLARTFYSEETINDVLSNNIIIETDQSTDISQITFITNSSGIYDSEYEREILDHGASDYKIIDLKGTNYRGHLVVLYDASRVKLALSSSYGKTGQYITTIARNNNAVIAMNASGFYDPYLNSDGGLGMGYVIKDGKIISSYGGGESGLIGFDKNNVLILTHDDAYTAIQNGMRDAVEFGPFLIVNGQASYIKGNGGWGIAPRSVIAQRKDGIVLFLVIDGRIPGYSVGADLVEVTRILQNYGAYNAANLDGGASTGLAVEGRLYNRPCALSQTGQRGLPDAWIYTSKN